MADLIAMVSPNVLSMPMLWFQCINSTPSSRVWPFKRGIRVPKLTTVLQIYSKGFQLKLLCFFRRKRFFSQEIHAIFKLEWGQSTPLSYIIIFWYTIEWLVIKSILRISIWSWISKNFILCLFNYHLFSFFSRESARTMKWCDGNIHSLGSFDISHRNGWNMMTTATFIEFSLHSMQIFIHLHKHTHNHNNGMARRIFTQLIMSSACRTQYTSNFLSIILFEFLNI